MPKSQITQTVSTDFAAERNDVQATAFVRKMRGRSQACLLHASDGHYYVVKLATNPQHRRVLINEWAIAALMRALSIATPQTAVVWLSPEFLAENPEVNIQSRTGSTPVEPGPHLGSRYPGDPATTVVYDFLPQAVLPQVSNLSHFAGAFVVDLWTVNVDVRQAIFFREAQKENAPADHPTPRRFVAEMIDHGSAFNGAVWSLDDSRIRDHSGSPLNGIGYAGPDDFSSWLDRVEKLSETVLHDSCRALPAQWVNDDGIALERLLQGLAERRRRIAELLASHARVFRTQSDTNQQNNQSVRAGPAVSSESSRPSRSPVPVPFGIPVQSRKTVTATIGG